MPQRLAPHNNKKRQKTMKTKSKFAHYIYAALAMLVMAFATTACSDENTSDLLLNGDCNVTSMALDQY